LVSELLVRRAEVDDARIIAEIHVASWRETYAGTMPSSVLAALDVDEREARWRDLLAAATQGADDAVFLVQRIGAPPAGFASCGRQRSEKLTRVGFAADFFVVYVLRSLQRQGAGRGLIGAIAANLKDRGSVNAPRRSQGRIMNR